LELEKSTPWISLPTIPKKEFYLKKKHGRKVWCLFVELVIDVLFLPSFCIRDFHLSACPLYLWRTCFKNYENKNHDVLTGACVQHFIYSKNDYNNPGFPTLAVTSEDHSSGARV
jgi:hypothetical protein